MDNTQIKPIETYYNGYRFRSRLEARWAVFFDAAGIKYQYEPEGYRYTDFDDNEYFYLPDFYLPDAKVYVEVKGSDKALMDDIYKICNAVDWDRTPMSDGLLILGEIPQVKKLKNNNYCYDYPVFPYLFNNKGVRIEYATFFPSRGYECHAHLAIGDNIFKYFFEIQSAYCNTDCFDNKWTNYGLIGDPSSDEPIMLTTNPCYISDCIEYNSDVWVTNNAVVLFRAYMKARQARFEHGEKG